MTAETEPSAMSFALQDNFLQSSDEKQMETIKRFAHFDMFLSVWSNWFKNRKLNRHQISLILAQKTMLAYIPSG